MLFTHERYDLNFGFCHTISNRTPRKLFHVNFTQMDPKTNDNKKSKLSPSATLQQLRSLRDNTHRLRTPDRLYNQDWFIGAVQAAGLEQVYRDDIAMNFRT